MQIQRDDRGATAVEYGLYVALVAGAMLGAVVFLTGALGLVFTSVAADPLIVGGPANQRANETVTPPVNETVTPPANGTVTPPANETVTPPANETETNRPATAPGTARALAASSSAKGKLTVSWDVPANDGGSDVLGYDVQIDDVTGGSTCAAPFSSSATQKVLSTTTSFTSVPGTTYCLRVRVINAKGTSDWVQTGPVSVIALTDPSAPRSVSATSPSRGTLDVTWTAPEDDGGTDITAYEVEIDDRSGKDSCASSFNESAKTTVTGRSAAFTGLEGSAYCVQVRAVNAEGKGDWAQAGIVAMSASVPGSPRDLKQDGESTSSIDLVWDDPSSNGGSEVTDYVVEYRKKGSGTWAVFADGVSDETEATVTGLSDNTNYEFRVAAVNRAGMGVPTDAITHKTDKKDKSD